MRPSSRLAEGENIMMALLSLTALSSLRFWVESLRRFGPIGSGSS